MLRRRILVTSAASLAAAVVAAKANDSAAAQLFRETPASRRSDVWMKQVKPAFAMAYFLGEADEARDVRPDVPGDPFASGQGNLSTPRVLLSEESNGRGEPALDVANLVSRVRQRVPLPLDKLTALVESIVNPAVKAPVAECYTPHHVVIAYDHLGVPCGVVEVCVTCYGCRLSPGGLLLRNDEFDIVQAAKILVDAGLPLCSRKGFTIEDFTREATAHIQQADLARKKDFRDLKSNAVEK